ncbi:MAG: hypothetical protein HN368_01555, partial [Spirochaetales bacterium]|nr:hypothetical protein [Spirochaetales bacterium]
MKTGSRPADRLYTAIDGGTPDRVPVVPKIWVDSASKLTGTRISTIIEDPLEALRVIAKAGTLSGVDAVRQFHFPPRRTLTEGDGLYEIDNNGEKIGDIDTEGGLTTKLYDSSRLNVSDPYFMSYHHYWHADEPPVKNLNEADRIAVPDGKFFDELGWGKRIRSVSAEYGEQLSFIGDCSSATMAFLVCLRGMNRAMIDLVDNPQLVHRIMEKGAEIAVAKGKYHIDQGLRILRLNDSVGNMSVISPEHWNEFVYPHMRDVCSELHAYAADTRIYCHICGNVLPIACELVQTGLDCIGPLDPLGGVKPGEIRSRVKNSVALMGGVNTLSLLNGTPETIEEEAASCIKEAGAHGGFILGSGCVVPRETSLKNLLALRTA